MESRIMHSGTGEGENLSLSTSAHPCHRFSLAEIQTATKDFDDELVIGHGGFGKVYKGQISSEEGCHVVAIKRLDSFSTQGATEFKAEIEILSKLRHCNLVSLIGYCDDNKEMILVYEYMPNGTLYHHLHKSETPLNWVQRIKIAIGGALGLDYLHTGVGSHHGIIHRDVKSTNILLDENWTALISDFGLSKIGPTNQSISYVAASFKGTFGYLDPEYVYTTQLTRKTDVFAFGVVLFELLSGRLAVDVNRGDECSLVRWAQKCVKERKVDQMVDSKMKGTVFPKCSRQFALIADRCVRSGKKERPTMTEVAASLHTLLELQMKYESSSNPSGSMGFNWRIRKYLVSTTKQNSDQSGTIIPEIDEDNMNQFSSSTNKDDSNHGEIEFESRDVKMFTYEELERATGNFRIVIRRSHRRSYGFKGWVDNTTYSPCEKNTGLPILVKKLLFYKPFDLEMLKKFRHPNLVKLIGYCLKSGSLFMVYEFMCNGNFEDLLNSGAIARIPLVTKVKILVGIARAIVFLPNIEDNITRDHWYGEKSISKSDLYRHKIFLDKDFTAKLSGYDITKLVHGYYPTYVYGPAPDDDCYPGREPFEPSSNLYGFTAILIEVLTGKKIRGLGTLNDLLDLEPGEKSWRDIATSCFEMCNEVDSESKIVKLLKKYIPEMTKCGTLNSRLRVATDGGEPKG